MRHLSLVAVLVCAVGVLAGCQAGLPGKADLPGKAGLDVTPNAVTGGAIETTALDASAAGVAPAEGTEGAKPVGPGKAPAQGGAMGAAQGDGKAGGKAGPAAGTPAAADGKTDEAAAPAATPAATPDAAPEPAAAPVPPKSEIEQACEKKRGKWARIGKGDLHACIYQTRDGGKRCERESQCEGVCLARSGTCSPLKPLYGCNDILQDDGRRVTLCLN